LTVRFEGNTDQLDQVIGNLLLAGVIISGVVAAAGGVLYLRHYGATTPDYRIFHGEPANLRDLQSIASTALSLKSQGIIQLGLLLLIATPIARVILSVFAFAFQRDALYVVITLIVLAVLTFSLLGGSV
jgi:uncharacterized membrane protein